MRSEYLVQITAVVLFIISLVNEIVSEPRRGWFGWRRRRRRSCKPVDCIPGEWGPWSACSHTCGPNGHSTTRRNIIRYAQCGGKCLVTTIGAKACNRYCMNGGTLIRTSCHCKAGYKGECCVIETGTWTSWGAWCGCSKTCGQGTQYRKRSCTKPSGTGCPGISKEYRTCMLKSCNLDGGWSVWSHWGQCTGSCGSGLQTRKRSCTNPRPGYGGKKCSGPAEQHSNCFLKRCPVNGGWSPWSTWCTCSKTCGTGSQYRRRSCSRPRPTYGGKPCVGQAKQTRNCNRRLCPVHGGWSSWSRWSACSKTFGNGKQYSRRYCNNPVPKYGGKKCFGRSVKTRDCNVKPCPVNGRWSKWAAWSKCTKTCGQGTQTRVRTCTNPPPKYGGRCLGPTTQTKSCLEKKCPVDGGWGAWSKWYACSKTCGTGTQYRSRLCNNPSPTHGGQECSGPRKMTQECNTKICPVNGCWSLWARWSACSKTCGTGTKTRKRSCTNPPPQNGGKGCKGPGGQTKSCLLKKCPVVVNGGWGNWSDWSACSVSCGSGTSIRTRRCNNPPPGPGGTACVGLPLENKPCNLGPCPTVGVVNGGWGKWSEWSACSVSCGPGTSIRTRRCDNPPPGPGGSTCMGLPVDSKPCDQGPCPGNCWSDWSDWSQCSKACGCGRQFRVRFCNCAHGQGHNQCQGPGESSQTCNCNACPNGPPF